MKRIMPVFVLMLLFSISATAPPPMPIGLAGYITVNGEPIEDNITIYITNINTSTTVTARTENGYYANALSATDGNKIKVNFTYRGKNYENFTTVNTSLLTHWVNFTITIEIEPTPPCIDIPETFYGTVGEEVVFDASNCYDLDGEIVSYEWVIYDYPPISLSGKTVSYTWDKPCSLVGLFKVTDNDGLSNTTMFNVIINENPSPPEPPQDNETDEGNESNEIKPPVANFTVEGNLIVEETIYLNSTSYDEDGEIVFWEWNVSGEKYYGNNITVIFNESGEYTITLSVRDNDGLNASISKNITIEEKPVEYHRLIISSNKPVNLMIIGNGTLYEDNGTYFVVRLPEGTYTIQWEHDGKIDSDVVLLNEDKEYNIDIPDNDDNNKLIPGFEFMMFIIAFAVLLRRKFNQL